MSTTTAVMSVNANMQSAIAAQHARQASETACRAWMPNFTDVGAAVDAKRAYAECVGLLHPGTLNSGDALFIKALVVAAVIGLIFGMVKGGKDDGAVGVVMGGLCGVLGFPAIAAILGALAFGVRYLFS